MEIKWNYPDITQLPEPGKKVLCIEDDKNFQIGFHGPNMKNNVFVDTSNRFFICKTWCELPEIPKKN